MIHQLNLTIMMWRSVSDFRHNLLHSLIVFYILCLLSYILQTVINEAIAKAWKTFRFNLKTSLASCQRRSFLWFWMSSLIFKVIFCYERCFNVVFCFVAGWFISWIWRWWWGGQLATSGTIQWGIQERGPEGPGTPLIFRPKWGRKNFFELYFINGQEFHLLIKFKT